MSLFALTALRRFTTTATKMLISVEFEVFGHVQGVFFRKYTRNKARELDLKGWVRNTNYDTVRGVMQGNKEAIEEMKEWLRTTGSPHSRIDKCNFENERTINAPEFKSFEVVH